MFYIAWLFILAAFALAAWRYRDKLAEWAPGWKHAISVVALKIYALAEALQLWLMGQEPLLTRIFTEKPLAVPMALLSVGALIFVLSMVTPRKESE